MWFGVHEAERGVFSTKRLNLTQSKGVRLKKKRLISNRGGSLCRVCNSVQKGRRAGDGEDERWRGESKAPHWLQADGGVLGSLDRRGAGCWALLSCLSRVQARLALTLVGGTEVAN